MMELSAGEAEEVEDLSWILKNEKNVACQRGMENVSWIGRFIRGKTQFYSPSAHSGDCWMCLRISVPNK